MGVSFLFSCRRSTSFPPTPNKRNQKKTPHLEDVRPAHGEPQRPRSAATRRAARRGGLPAQRRPEVRPLAVKVDEPRRRPQQRRAERAVEQLRLRAEQRVGQPAVRVGKAQEGGVGREQGGARGREGRGGKHARVRCGGRRSPAEVAEVARAAAAGSQLLLLLHLLLPLELLQVVVLVDRRRDDARRPEPGPRPVLCVRAARRRNSDHVVVLHLHRPSPAERPAVSVVAGRPCPRQPHQDAVAGGQVARRHVHDGGTGVPDGVLPVRKRGEG